MVLLLPPLRLPLRSPRRRVSSIWVVPHNEWILTSVAEKEESDEDMGFGLFD